MDKPVEDRNKWALGLALSCSALVLLSFFIYKGVFTLSDGTLAVGEGQDQMASALSAPSPFESSQRTWGSMAEEIGEQYKEFTESLSNVFVPFIEGIDVYERP